MATNKPRYTVSVDNDLFQKIENFRFEKRFKTRSEATVKLIRLGLEALEKKLEVEKMVSVDVDKTGEVKTEDTKQLNNG